MPCKLYSRYKGSLIMISVEVANTFLVNMGKEFVILLRSSDDERTLPISIGQLEAQSIAMQLNQVPFPRPLTHDLFKSILTDIGCKLTSAIICDLADETFYAKLTFDLNGKKIEADSRPSDAIALALRFAAPIFVAEKVMEEAGVVITEESEAENQVISETSFNQKDSNEPVTPLESLQKQLQKAVQDERYEDAAQLRDDIGRMAKSN
jgi:uncharacterized protein